MERNAHMDIIMLIPSVKGEKILEALSAYDNKFLYQKCGYRIKSFVVLLGKSVYNGKQNEICGDRELSCFR